MTREIVEALKKVLKARGMTYADLARALRVSTPTVKRLFSQRTFTLQRLEEILKVIELDFYELARLSHGRRSGPVELSLEQEAALAKDARLFSVFWLICNEWRFEEIVAEFRIGAAQITRSKVTFPGSLSIICMICCFRVMLPPYRPRMPWYSISAMTAINGNSIKVNFGVKGFDKALAAMGMKP